MEIGSTNSIALSALTKATTPTSQAIGLEMLNKQLDVTNQMGSSMIRAMENSVNPSVGGNFDMSL